MNMIRKAATFLLIAALAITTAAAQGYSEDSTCPTDPWSLSLPLGRSPVLVTEDGSHRLDDDIRFHSWNGFQITAPDEGIFLLESPDGLAALVITAWADIDTRHRSYELEMYGDHADAIILLGDLPDIESFARVQPTTLILAYEPSYWMERELGHLGFTIRMLGDADGIAVDDGYISFYRDRQPSSRPCRGGHQTRPVINVMQDTMKAQLTLLRNPF